MRLYPKELPSGDTADKVAAVSFSPTGLYLAVSKGNTVSVYHTQVSQLAKSCMSLTGSPPQSCVLDTTLLGHSALISCVLFTTPNPVTVVSLSHDRTFKVRPPDMCMHVHHLMLLSISEGLGPARVHSDLPVPRGVIFPFSLRSRQHARSAVGHGHS